MSEIVSTAENIIAMETDATKKIQMNHYVNIFKNLQTTSNTICIFYSWDLFKQNQSKFIQIVHKFDTDVWNESFCNNII